MSMDFMVVCHTCKKCIWFGKISGGQGANLHQDQKASTFMYEHANCCIARPFEVCTLEDTPDGYEDVDP